MSSLIVLAAESGGFGEMAAEKAQQFGVAWWLFLSQLVSFSIVAFLLHRFAYRPILQILAERRQRIEEGLRNAEQIKVQLAEAQKTSAEIIGKASVEAQKLIDEARAAAKALQERHSQQAIAEAEQIVARAREATEIDRARMMADLRRELSRLVINTTSKVSGKVLTMEDQRRLTEETAREIAA
ncbi:MAG: F0F1 ATP synthase subunit B [Verrucomicrobiota bacterium]|nr:F0F1 ATP synthase subunit B [Verrucomicrobiota bacterium]